MMCTLKILLTGRPGVGKTTAILRALALLPAVPARGFYTRELRGPHGRVGFEMVTLDGRTHLLAHVELASRHRVGKYRVDVEGFERAILASIDPAAGSSSSLIVVDEIGAMECLSPLFRQKVLTLLASPAPLLGTIGQQAGGFVSEVKSRPEVTLVEVTAANRTSLPAWIAEQIRSVGSRMKGASP